MVRCAEYRLLKKRVAEHAPWVESLACRSEFLGPGITALDLSRIQGNHFPQCRRALKRSAMVVARNRTTCARIRRNGTSSAVPIRCSSRMRSTRSSSLGRYRLRGRKRMFPPKFRTCDMPLGCTATTARAFWAAKTGARAYTGVPVRGRAPRPTPSRRSRLHS